MQASVFLTCFLACLFAFVVFGVLGWQIAAFFIKRAITKKLPEMLAQAVHGNGGATAHAGVSADFGRQIVQVMNEDELNTIIESARQELEGRKRVA